ncbi:MAG: fibrillarin-like rRNA/tRNA 2'-O-methyltransferase, partial [Candidatus Thermoplasmatota archaeon]|nr:fibrillarin-like rRNA/tRNA 2'-O-methyltransferase [Candidatus Thermoplasmatota archaeon]
MGGGKKRRQRGPQQLSSTVRLDRRALWTRNAVPGSAVYGESLRNFSGKEHRRWDPNRSKLGAGMLRTQHDPARLLPEQGSTVLYLGAGHGTSVSHLYDHLCGAANRFGGRLVCV